MNSTHTEFRFTEQQRAAIVKLLGSDRGVTNLERDVGNYIEESRLHLTLAELRDCVREIEKHGKALRRAVQALADKGVEPPAWLSEVAEFESTAAAFRKWRFKRPLRRGRPPHAEEVNLAQRAAALWTHLRGERPGRGRGPFAALLRVLFEASGVKGAPIECPDELVPEVSPFGLTLETLGADYPFAPLDEEESLPPPRRKAQEFFKRALWIAEGRKTITVFKAPTTGEKAPES